MKIKNVESFRNELYKALEDVFFTEVEWIDCMWKGGNEYRDIMKSQSTWEKVDGEFKCVSLPQVLKIEDAKLAITVDDEDVEIWSTAVKTHYVRLVTMPMSLRENKMALAMEVALMVEKYWKSF